MEAKGLSLLQEEGSQGLEKWLEAERERNLPEFRRQRPKYYYLYEWIKERISQHCGALPAPVLDKLLNIEAGELDTLLNYPKGIQAKVRKPLIQMRNFDTAVIKQLHTHLIPTHSGV